MEQGHDLDQRLWRPPARAVVALGGSAGGIAAIRCLLAAFPTDLVAAVLVVVHTSATGPGALADVLCRDSPLPVSTAVHGDHLRAGWVYVAPPDRHLCVRHDAVVVSDGPKVNWVRPAIDPMLESVARWWGTAAIAVVASGALSDGAAGVAAIVARGGLAFAQADAPYPGMPDAARAVGVAVRALPIAELGPAVEFAVRMRGDQVVGRAGRLP